MRNFDTRSLIPEGVEFVYFRCVLSAAPKIRHMTSSRHIRLEIRKH